MFPFFPQKSFSHLLIVFCIIIASFWILFPELIDRFGLSGRYISSGDYISLFIQVILFQFLHGGWFHLFLNSYFLYSAGPTLEARMSRDRYTWFFITTTVFVALALLILQPYVLTIGISGFCMALLSYLWIDLYTTRHPAASQILIMLLINIGIWLIPGISLVGHAAGAVWGIIWWWIFRDWKK
jgi:membrane associated rhomboid family serine protease